MAKRIFDDPNHPQYGPVRRMWVILAQLDMLETAERWGEWQSKQGGFGGTWDQFLAGSIQANPDLPESANQRFLLSLLLQFGV